MKKICSQIIIVLAVSVGICLWTFDGALAQSESPNPTSVPNDEGLIGSVVDEVIGFLKRKPAPSVAPLISGSPSGSISKAPELSISPEQPSPIEPTPVQAPPVNGQCNQRTKYANNVVVSSLDGICEYCASQVSSNNFSCIDKLQSANAPLPKIGEGAAELLRNTRLMDSSVPGVKYLQCKVHSQAMMIALFGKIAPSGGGLGANAMKNVRGENGFQFIEMNSSNFGRVGDLLIYDGTQFGHVGTIVGVNGTSGYTIVDANFSLRGHVRIAFEPHVNNPSSRRGLRPIGFLRKIN